MAAVARCRRGLGNPSLPLRHTCLGVSIWLSAGKLHFKPVPYVRPEEDGEVHGLLCPLTKLQVLMPENNGKPDSNLVTRVCTR